MIFGAQAHVIWKTVQFNPREAFHLSAYQIRLSITAMEIMAQAAILNLLIMESFNNILILVFLSISGKYGLYVEFLLEKTFMNIVCILGVVHQLTWF